MFALSMPLPLPLPLFATAAWLCAAFGVFIIATMIPPKYRRMLQATGTAMVLVVFIGRNLMFYLPSCEDADLLTWLAMGCYFLS